ncbi:hypothetical protein V3519_14080 [Acinetobacter variabilis]
MAKYSDINSFNTLETLTVGSEHYQIFNLSKLQVQLGDLSRLPKFLKVLLENLLRFEDQLTVKTEHIYALAGWLNKRVVFQKVC